MTDCIVKLTKNSKKTISSTTKYMHIALSNEMDRCQVSRRFLVSAVGGGRDLQCETRPDASDLWGCASSRGSFVVVFFSVTMDHGWRCFLFFFRLVDRSDQETEKMLSKFFKHVLGFGTSYLWWRVSKKQRLINFETGCVTDLGSERYLDWLVRGPFFFCSAPQKYMKAPCKLYILDGSCKKMQRQQTSQVGDLASQKFEARNEYKKS